MSRFVLYIIGYTIIFFHNVTQIFCFGELYWESRIVETYRIYDVVSLMDCVSYCGQSDGCCSINYSRQLRLCELNYKTKENGTMYSDEDVNGFINSNIATWMNNAKSSCLGKSCGPNKQCSQTMDTCVVVDCGKAPNGPPNSYLRHYGHHVVGNIVVYACEQGYNMFKGTRILEANRIVARCTKTGEWERDEFTCKACDVPIDCQDIKRYFSAVGGVYQIKPRASKFYIEVYCDMDMKKTAWTVFQRRIDGSINFFNDWETYKKGFGNVSGEYWLGNELIHNITSQSSYRLRVDLGDFAGENKYARYQSFSIEDEQSNYRLNINTYTGTAGNSLRYHKNRPFSTEDDDNDSHKQANCAMDYKAGWWFVGCLQSNLNGEYFSSSYTSRGSKVFGIVWRQWHWPSTLKTSTMKMARNDYEFEEAKNCEDVKKLSTEPRSGVYRINPGGKTTRYFVYCEFGQTDAWTVFQRRIIGQENFNRESADYRNGFGNLHREFWLVRTQADFLGAVSPDTYATDTERSTPLSHIILTLSTQAFPVSLIIAERQAGGTDAIHAVTKLKNHILRVEVIDFCNVTWLAEYSQFQVGSENENYRLSISGYSGTAGNDFGLANDKPFTVSATASAEECPIQYTGAWWYDGCPFPNLNGGYNKNNGSGIAWYNWKGEKQYLKETTMKMRL